MRDENVLAVGEERDDARLERTVCGWWEAIFVVGVVIENEELCDATYHEKLPRLMLRRHVWWKLVLKLLLWKTRRKQ